MPRTKGSANGTNTVAKNANKTASRGRKPAAGKGTRNNEVKAKRTAVAAPVRRTRKSAAGVSGRQGSDSRTRSGATKTRITVVRPTTPRAHQFTVNQVPNKYLKDATWSEQHPYLTWVLGFAATVLIGTAVILGLIMLSSWAVS